MFISSSPSKLTLRDYNSDGDELFVIELQTKLLSKSNENFITLGFLNIVFPSLRKAFNFHTRYSQCSRAISFSRSASSQHTVFESKYDPDLNLKFVVCPYRGQRLVLDPVDYYYRNSTTTAPAEQLTSTEWNPALSVIINKSPSDALSEHTKSSHPLFLTTKLRSQNAAMGDLPSRAIAISTIYEDAVRTVESKLLSDELELNENKIFLAPNSQKIIKYEEENF